MTGRRVGIALVLTALLAWEAYWLEAYLNRSIPDESMSGPAAIIFGLILPGAAIVLIAAARLSYRALSRFRDR